MYIIITEDNEIKGIFETKKLLYSAAKVLCDLEMDFSSFLKMFNENSCAYFEYSGFYVEYFEVNKIEDR